MTSHVTDFTEPVRMLNYTSPPNNEHESEAVNLSAGRYSKSNTLQRRFNNLVLDVYQERFIANVRSTHQVLDVGCGTGDFTRDVILPRCLPCRKIVGVDSSGEMIEYARRYSANEKLDFRVLDICDDVTDFLEEFGRFDRVYSFYCLHWAEDLVLALKNVSRLMTQTGECLLLFYASHESVPVWRALASMDRWKKYSEVLLKFVPKSQDMGKTEQYRFLSGHLKKAGLVPSVIEVVQSATYADSTEKETLDTQMGVLPIAQLVSQEEKAQLLTDVTEQVRRVHDPHADQERYRMYIVMASKYRC
ncbi:juvenile hormone acid O-methyltransferase [Rhipicephalus sanguineus]|uniref:Methyltransferase domain-containing protein n=1 Tax=Rhipicephalus sanguineus TaxID=34632 RepID=A0A9D4SP59_RHISA|nr:juvenile hormone acid O-methyltransferase [Rhipicephalus sanguineus]KAH7938843.1 hypothetical protein HPB52_000853 [Rhipicephalus sanguineus]